MHFRWVSCRFSHKSGLEDRATMVPKLADFGLARKNVGTRDCRTFCGTCPGHFEVFHPVFEAFQEDSS